MDAKNDSLLRTGSWLAGSVLLIAAPTLGHAADDQKDAFPNYESYIKVSGQAANVTGNEPAFETRRGESGSGGLGIEELHFGKDLSKTTTLTVDGRALSGSEDYLFHLNVTKNEIGSIDAGYKRFRTFYDGTGGFFPLNKSWFKLTPEALHVDRGEFWAGFKLEMPDKPLVEVKYTNRTRSGQKDSTAWGDTNLTGLPKVPTNNATRKIVPVLLDLDERQQELEALVRHTVGNTTAQLRIAGEWVNNVDSRYFTRYPGEVTPNPERVNAQVDGNKTRALIVTGTTETEFSDKITLNTGVSYEKLKGDVWGERPNAIGVLPTYDFKDLKGKTSAEVYTANLAVQYKPTPEWQITPAVRAEDSYTRADGTFTRITMAGKPSVATPSYFKEYSRVKDKIVTPDLSVRYTGIKRVVIYANASDRIVDGDDRHFDQFSTVRPTKAQNQTDDINQDQSHYTVGANWNQSAKLILRAEVFRKDHENKFIGYDTQLGNRYVVGYQFTGVKLSAIVKPIPQLSFTTRYQPQTGKMQVTTDSTAKFDSMDAKSHLIGETIDWNPSTAFYMQANANVVFNYISTAYPRDQAPITIAPQRNSDNNYVSGSILGGFSASKDDDIQFQYTYQKADNYEPGIAKGTQPYGAGYRESQWTVGVKHKFNDKLIGVAKAGYIDSKDETFGGNLSFKGPVGYVSLEYAL